MKDQQERQTRLRHVQEFLSSPTFLDLSDMPVEVADDPEALAERQRDLTYRITLLRSLLELLEGEVKALNRLRNGADEPAPEGERRESSEEKPGESPAP